jgi:phospholipid N-methyltransferase
VDKISQMMRTGASYLRHGTLAAWQTAMIWPPSDPFVQHIRGKMDKDVRTILNLGCGPGVLEMALLENGQPADLCVSVDCNEDFLRVMKLNLRQTKVSKAMRQRVRMVNDRAENVEHIIKEQFKGKPIDWFMISFSIKVVGRETTRKIIETIKPHLSGRGGGMIWNYLPTDDVMTAGFDTVNVEPVPCWSLLPWINLQVTTGRDEILSTVNGHDHPAVLNETLLSPAHQESSPRAPLPSGT